MSNQSREFHRFQLYTGKEDPEGKVVKDKGVGMAYVQEGQITYTLKLWILQGEKYYLLPHREEPNYHLLMTREENRQPNAKRKYFWNVVGNGVADASQGYLKINFDIFLKPIYMSIFPERMASSTRLAEPEPSEITA